MRTRVISWQEPVSLRPLYGIEVEMPKFVNVFGSDPYAPIRVFQHRCQWARWGERAEPFETPDYDLAARLAREVSEGKWLTKEREAITEFVDGVEFTALEQPADAGTFVRTP